MFSLNTGQLDDRIVTIASDDTFWPSKILPVGSSSNGYILKCNVTVTDSRGAKAVYPIHDVQVKQFIINMTYW